MGKKNKIKEKIKIDRPKERIPTAPGQIAHKDKKKYDRKKERRRNKNAHKEN